MTSHRLFAADARPAAADPTGGNQVVANELKTASVAVATTIDTLQRSIIGSGSSVCLRGESFQTNHDITWMTTLTNCEFASDVIVNGTIVWGANTDGSLTADVTSAAKGQRERYCTFPGSGSCREPRPMITGTLGSMNVAALVPKT